MFLMIHETNRGGPTWTIHFRFQGKIFVTTSTDNENLATLSDQVGLPNRRLACAMQNGVGLAFLHFL
jgi:hypothetical protein